MQEGILFYNEHTRRMDIVFESGETYGGLHCGETFDVFDCSRWMPVRIEKGDDWYLIGIKAKPLPGLKVRK